MTYQGKILVTGASSFIGHHLCLFFHHSGYQVVATGRQNRSDYHGIPRFRIQTLMKQEISWKVHDMNDEDSWDRLLKNNRVDYVIHHAGYAKDCERPDFDLEKGYRENVRVLDMLYPKLKKHKVQGLILSGTSSEYSMTSEPLEEENVCYPVLPYGLSKLMATLRSFQCAHQYGIQTRVARLFHPYGAYDSEQRLIPSVVKSLKQGQMINLDDGQAVRDFVFVEDVARGYLALIRDFERDCLWDLFNFCTGEGVSVKEFLIEVVRVLRADQNLLQFGMKESPSLLRAVCGSVQKTRDQLFWSPRDWKTGLKNWLGE